MTATEFHRRGVARYECGDLLGALRDHRRALRLDPDRADILNDRGIVQKARGKFAEALKDYDAALKVDPAYWQARANRGTLLAQQDLFARAVHEYTLGIRSAPRQAVLFYFRANSLGCLGDYRGALRDYSRALRLDPTCGAAWFCRSATHRVIGGLHEADGEVMLEAQTIRPSLRKAMEHWRAAQSDLRQAVRFLPPSRGFASELPESSREIRAALRRLGRRVRRR